MSESLLTEALSSSQGGAGKEETLGHKSIN